MSVVHCSVTLWVLLTAGKITADRPIAHDFATGGQLQMLLLRQRCHDPNVDIVSSTSTSTSTTSTTTTAAATTAAATTTTPQPLLTAITAATPRPRHEWCSCKT
jgi:hypothetical protein